MKKYSLLLIVLLFSGCFNKKQIELKMYSIRPDISSTLNKTISLFNEENNNITITIEEIRRDALDIYDAKFRTGDAADILMMPSYKYLFKSAEKGVLADLSDKSFVKRIPLSMKTGISFNNKVYGFPMNINIFGVLYNENIFDKNDLDVPGTKSELIDICKKISSSGITPFDSPLNNTQSLNYIFAMGNSTLLKEPPLLWIENMNLGKASFNVDNINNFFDVLDVIKGYSQFDEENRKSQTDDFVTGKTAMILQSGQFYNRIKRRFPNLEIGFFPLPLDDNINNTKLFTDVEFVFAVNSNIDKDRINAAKKYLEFLSEKECQNLLVNESFLFTPYYSEKESDKIFNQISSYLKDNKTVSWSFRLWSSNVFEKSGSCMMDYFSNKIERNEAIDSLDNTWKKFK